MQIACFARIRISLLAALVVVAGTRSQAVVDTTLDIFENGELQTSLDADELNCADTGPGTTRCSIENITAGDLAIFSLRIDLFEDPEIDASFALQNNSIDTQRFTLRITASASIPESTLTGGSAAFDFQDNVGDGAKLAAPADSAIYTALIDGSPYQVLFPDPSSGTAPLLGSGAIGPESFGTPIPSQSGPTVTSSIGLQYDFTLTGLDGAGSSESKFVVKPVPEPTRSALLSAGLLALALVAARRRC